jgi:hypothetical protein
MKAKNLGLLITVLTIILATCVGYTSNASAQSVCSPATAVSVPFAKDGAGTFCYQASSMCAFINSWNLTTLSINGNNYTNIWVSGPSIPALNGTFTITYNSPVGWGHFEIGGPCSGGSNPTATATRTNTPAGPTPTRTNTPSGGNLPDLTVSSITYVGSNPTCANNPKVQVVVANIGAFPASGAFSVSVNGAASQTVNGLAAGQSVTLTFNAGSSTATVD